MSDGTKVRENRLRRAAERQGLQLQRSRRRDRLAIDFGGYMLIDVIGNFVVAGGSPRPFSMSLDQVETWLAIPRHRGEPIETCNNAPTHPG